MRDDRFPLKHPKSANGDELNEDVQSNVRAIHPSRMSLNMQATSSHWKNLRFCSNVAVRRTKAAPILASESPLGMYLHQARAFLPVPIAIFSETSIIQAASVG